MRIRHGGRDNYALGFHELFWLIRLDLIKKGDYIKGVNELNKNEFVKEEITEAMEDLLFDWPLFYSLISRQNRFTKSLNDYLEEGIGGYYDRPGNADKDEPEDLDEFDYLGGDMQIDFSKAINAAYLKCRMRTSLLFEDLQNDGGLTPLRDMVFGEELISKLESGINHIYDEISIDTPYLRRPQWLPEVYVDHMNSTEFLKREKSFQFGNIELVNIPWVVLNSENQEIDSLSAIHFGLGVYILDTRSIMLSMPQIVELAEQERVSVESVYAFAFSLGVGFWLQHDLRLIPTPIYKQLGLQIHLKNTLWFAFQMISILMINDDQQIDFNFVE